MRTGDVQDTKAEPTEEADRTRNARGTTETIRACKHRTPFKPFTVATVSGNRYEADYPGPRLAVREGPAIFVEPGRVPVFFDHEGVSEVNGDLSGHKAETS